MTCLRISKLCTIQQVLKWILLHSQVKTESKRRLCPEQEADIRIIHLSTHPAQVLKKTMEAISCHEEWFVCHIAGIR